MAEVRKSSKKKPYQKANSKKKKWWNDYYRKNRAKIAQQRKIRRQRKPDANKSKRMKMYWKDRRKAYGIKKKSKARQPKQG